MVMFGAEGSRTGKRKEKVWVKHAQSESTRVKFCQVLIASMLAL